MVADRTLAEVADDQTLKDPRKRVTMRKKSSQLQMEMEMVAEVAAEIVDDEVAATTTARVEMVKTNVVEEIFKGVVATAAEVGAKAGLGKPLLVTQAENKDKNDKSYGWF